jgi:hypothetical protein
MHRDGCQMHRHPFYGSLLRTRLLHDILPHRVYLSGNKKWSTGQAMRSRGSELFQLAAHFSWNIGRQGYQVADDLRCLTQGLAVDDRRRQSQVAAAGTASDSNGKGSVFVGTLASAQDAGLAAWDTSASKKRGHLPDDEVAHTAIDDGFRCRLPTI